MHYEGDESEIKYKVIHKSYPPFRWIANGIGTIASSALLRIAIMEENGKTSGIKYVINGYLWDYLWPIYDKWGTVYVYKSKEEDI